MRAIGVDIGLDGAAVLVDSNLGVVDQVLMLYLDNGKPWTPAKAAAWREWLIGSFGVRLVLIESRSIRPGEGAGSALTTGAGWGLVVGVPVGMGLDVRQVTPPTWRRMIGLPVARDRNHAKRSAIEYARHMQGLDLTPGRRRVPHTGLADAACIAAAALTIAHQLES